MKLVSLYIDKWELTLRTRMAGIKCALWYRKWTSKFTIGYLEDGTLRYDLSSEAYELLNCVVLLLET